MDSHFKLEIKEKQKLIDFIAMAYSLEDIFSLGRNINIEKDTYYGFGMNNMQLADAFVSRVFQLGKESELLEIIRNNKYLKRPAINEIFGLIDGDIEGSKNGLMDSLYAIIIGVNDYKNVQGCNSLNLPYYDAEGIKDTLIKRWNVNPDNILLFNESSTTTYNAIEKPMRDLILNLTDRDNLLFYFSGHGHEINGNSFLLLSDTAYNPTTKRYGNVIVLEELNDLFKQSKAKLKLRVFDACRCGQSFSKGTVKTLSPKLKADMLGGGNGWITFTSCNIDEYSWEDPKLQHGVFTYYFLQGLNGKARREIDKMYIEDLKIYISNNVPSYVSRYMNDEQNPQYHCEVEGNILIG